MLLKVVTLIFLILLLLKVQSVETANGQERIKLPECFLDSSLYSNFGKLSSIVINALDYKAPGEFNCVRFDVNLERQEFSLTSSFYFLGHMSAGNHIEFGLQSFQDGIAKSRPTYTSTFYIDIVNKRVWAVFIDGSVKEYTVDKDWDITHLTSSSTSRGP